MEIILSRNCESFTGSIGRGFGYHIQRRKNGFFGKRNSKGDVPHDGHWRFIVACAEIAKIGLHVRDIRVPAYEVAAALDEAHNHWATHHVKPIGEYNADDILQLKERLVL